MSHCFIQCEFIQIFLCLIVNKTSLVGFIVCERAVIHLYNNWNRPQQQSQGFLAIRYKVRLTLRVWK